MIASDSSSLIAYFDGSAGSDVDVVEGAFEKSDLALPPVVLTELLSNRFLSLRVAALLKGLPRLAPDDGYWERAGLLRARVLSHGFKARLGDALIAQSCIDHDVPLVARDADYRHFARWGGLKLLR